MECLLLIDPPEGAPFSNCEKATQVLALALPTVSEAIDKPCTCSRFLQRKRALCGQGATPWLLPKTRWCGPRRGGTRLGSHCSRGSGRPVFPTADSRQHLPAPLPQARCSIWGSSKAWGNLGPQGARKGRAAFYCFYSLGPHSLPKMPPLEISTTNDFPGHFSLFLRLLKRWPWSNRNTSWVSSDT